MAITAIDFNKDYVLHTSKGDYLLPIFYVDRALSTYDTGYPDLYYKGVNVVGTAVVSEFQASVPLSATYRYSYSPVMGQIDITDKNGNILTGINAWFNSSVSGNQATHTRHYNNTNMSSSGSMGGTRDVIDAEYYYLIIDSAGTGYFGCQGIRNVSQYISDPDDFVLEVNTADKFGFLYVHNYIIGAISVTTGAANTLIPNILETEWAQALDLLYPAPADPYAEGGTSQPGGGSGTFDGSTDSVDFPAGVPSAAAANTGFIKLFNPSAANLSALAAYLWGSFDMDSFKSIYNNPIDCIIALSVVPVQPTVDEAAIISLGNVATNVSAAVISDQFVILDCGSLDINEFWGAYLDYDPYTKCEIYLPYIGVQDIDINDIMGKTIQLKYYIDVLSGACVAMLKAGPDVLYNWSGQCAAEVPITSTGFGSVFQTALSAANSIGETIVNALSGIPQNVAQVATSVFNGARSKVHKSGSIGSMAGHMGIQKPYLIITRPVQSVPENLDQLQGYPSNITAVLGDLSGYTVIDTVYLADIPATASELDEIEQLLKGGIII